MSRLENERAFHDRRFRDNGDSRAELGKYYSIYTLNTAFFNRLLKRHLPGADALEFGCAKGEKALRWARAGARIRGIDISGEAVRIANERAQREQLSAEFYTMNAEQMDFPDASFDVVFGEGILHHLDLDKAFAELARVLKPGGRAIFVEPLGHNPLLNLYRKLTPRMRTDDEHPLLRRDLERMGSFFGRVDVEYFHLATLAAIPLRNTVIFEPFLTILRSFDRALLKLLSPLRHWSWVAVVEMVGPRA